MNLITETYRFARWTTGVTRRFLRVRPWSTVAVTLASAVDGVLQLVAFLVPLKIILLAASPGIPRYFPFIDPAHKMPWIIGLSIGAVGAYLTSLLLNHLSDRWSRSAGRDVLRGANDLAVHAKEEDQAQRAFGDFTGIIASLLFLSAAGAVLIWANPALAIFLGVMVALLGLISVPILAGDAQPPPPLKAWVTQKTGQYLGFWQVLTFFGAFGVILYPFLIGGGGNIFLAIIGFILVRRMLGGITGSIAKAARLVGKRPAIDALIYRSQQVVSSGEEDRFHAFRALFGPTQRDPLIREALQAALGDGVEIRSTYVDPMPAPIKRFDVSPLDIEAERGHLEARVFPPNCLDQVANAAFLFNYVPREQLHAPAVRATFDYRDYTIVIQEAGNGERCEPGKPWAGVQVAIIRNMLSLTPPKRLAKSYCDTHRVLSERLTQAFCERLWIGVDSEAEASTLTDWLDRLPHVTRLIAQQPLALYNPDINPPNVISDTDGPLVMAWGKWGLEPIGAAMAKHGWVKDAESHLDALKASRADLTGYTWEGDLKLAADCYVLEQTINTEKYKAGLAMIDGILRGLKNGEPAQSRVAAG